MQFDLQRTAELLQHDNNPNNTDQFTKSGIYQLTCPDCNKKYIGQKGSSFQMRYCEHLRDFKYQNGNSKFAQHFNDNNLSFGPIEKVMNVLHTIKKGTMMDTLEKYHIYKATKLGTQINDKNNMSHNMLFDNLIYDTTRGHP